MPACAQRVVRQELGHVVNHIGNAMDRIKAVEPALVSEMQVGVDDLSGMLMPDADAWQAAWLHSHTIGACACRMYCQCARCFTAGTGDCKGS